MKKKVLCFCFLILIICSEIYAKSFEAKKWNFYKEKNWYEGAWIYSNANADNAVLITDAGIMFTTEGALNVTRTYLFNDKQNIYLTLGKYASGSNTFNVPTEWKFSETKIKWKKVFVVSEKSKNGRTWQEVFRLYEDGRVENIGSDGKVDVYQAIHVYDSK